MSVPTETTSLDRSAEPGAADRSPGDRLARRRLFGLDFVDAESLDDVLRAVLDRAPTPEPVPGPDSAPSPLPILVTPNVDILVLLEERGEGEEVDVFRRAQFVLPDGMPIIAASRLLGVPLRSRLTGSGLFELLWPRLARQARPTVVVASDTEVVDRLRTEHPGAEFLVPPMLDLSSSSSVESFLDTLDRSIDEVGADYVLIGLGHPKDAVIASRLHARRAAVGRPVPLFLGLGGSFAMYAGLKRRAPAWMQRSGLEWLFRFAQEPRRLFHRYFVRDVAFLGIVWRAYRRRGSS